MCLQIDNIEMFKAALYSGINLFTGAGFSKLPDEAGKVLPDADELCLEICERFSIDSKYKDDLERLSNIVSMHYKDEFQAYLRERFTVCTFNKLYTALDAINIHSYITTNIDNIIQCVMDQSERYSLLNIMEYGATRNPSSLPFIPLHGNVKFPHSNLYFGKSELANVDTDNKDLFDLMHGKVLEAPTLFWGYGFHDNAVERTIAKFMQEKHQDIWVQCMPDSSSIEYFRDIGCHVIVGSTSDLLCWINENIKKMEKENPDAVDMSSLKQYLIPTVNQTEVVTREDYYTKGYTHWSCVLLNYAFQTQSVDMICESVLGSKNIIGIGIPFSGKTTILMQVATKIVATIKLVVTGITVEEAHRIINVIHGKRAFVFLDNCCDDTQVTALFMQQPNFYVFGCTDDYAYESSKHLLGDVHFGHKTIGELVCEDALGIYHKIPENLRKGDFIFKDEPDEKFSVLEFMSLNVKNQLSHKYIRELLKRVRDCSLQGFQIIALSAYLSFNKSCLNLDVLCSFFATTDYKTIQGYIEIAQGYLKEMDVTISYDQDYYELRSHLFSKLAYEELTKSFKPDFSIVVRDFILSVSPYKIYRYDIFKRSAYDAKFFSELFGNDAYDLYNCIYRFDGSEYTLQQQALYKAYRGDFSGAFADIDSALKKNPFNFSIKNSYAIILFEANKGKESALAGEGMSKAMETLQRCFHSDKRKVYHAQKFSEFSVFLSQKWNNREYLTEAQTWLEQIISDGESTTSRTKSLLNQVRKELARK